MLVVAVRCLCVLVILSKKIESILPEPDCYVSKAQRGVDCKDENLCIRLVSGSTDAEVYRDKGTVAVVRSPRVTAEDICDEDGVRATEFEYTRAVYAADELQCQLLAFADDFCIGNPQDGLVWPDDIRYTTAQKELMRAGRSERQASPRLHAEVLNIAKYMQ
eukprot:Lankesteria_metandrocarpae@DN893_c0_g1_i1.p1